MIKKKYDVFISYRRDSGSDLARFFNSVLERSGYDVFMDVNELNAGVFPLELEQAVINSELTLVLLTDGTLDRLGEPEDFVRKELELSYLNNKPFFIVSKIKDIYEKLNSNNLDSNIIKQLSSQNIIEYNHNLADSIVQKLKDTLERLKNKKFDFDDIAKDINVEEKGKLDFVYKGFKHRYVGELRSQRPYDEGILTDLINDIKFDGIWYGWETPEYSGKGKVYAEEKLVYEGAWKKLKYSGFGKLYEEDGIYYGYFIDGVKEGHGKKTFNNGDIYVGEWTLDKMKGYGEMKYINGDHYIGQFSNNQISGLGKCIYNNENKYDGDFSEGVPYGNGIMIYKSGFIYNGKWLRGRKRGEGKLTDLELKIIYDGCWDSGSFDGYGEFTYSNGMQYKGNWSIGIKKGNGALYDASGAKLYVGSFYGKDVINVIGAESYEKLAKEEYDVIRNIDSKDELDARSERQACRSSVYN